ncbi:MAG: carbohydrate ABC transporter permease [Ruminococcus sp.]|nr:carbohydrate ABC transporter permease [Ruminococcus sp.]
MEMKQKAMNVFIHVVLIIMSFVMLVPFAWMVLTAFKTVTESTQINPFVIFPTQWVTTGFKSALSKLNWFVLYKNTILLIVIRVVCACLTATMAGYALGRLHFKGSGLAFGLVMLQMMVPGQIFTLPQYLMMSKAGLLNTMFALVFPGLVTAFGTFLLKQGYMGLPKDLEEAARLDGCNIPQTFLWIMMPLTKSSMVSLGIFTALFAFKELMWPMIVATSNEMMVISTALNKLQGQYAKDYPELMAASLFACLPMIVLYLIFQKQFVEGIATSGGKL